MVHPEVYAQGKEEDRQYLQHIAYLEALLAKDKAFHKHKGCVHECRVGADGQGKDGIDCVGYACDGRCAQIGVGYGGYAAAHDEQPQKEAQATQGQKYPVFHDTLLFRKEDTFP